MRAHQLHSLIALLQAGADPSLLNFRLHNSMLKAVGLGFLAYVQLQCVYLYSHVFFNRCSAYVCYAYTCTCTCKQSKTRQNKWKHSRHALYLLVHFKMYIRLSCIAFIIPGFVPHPLSCLGGLVVRALVM